MYHDASEQERYFKFNTILISLLFVLFMTITVVGFVGCHETGVHTHKTSIACVKAGGSWVNDNDEWECRK